MAAQSPSSVGYRPGDMALLGLVMAALLLLCLTVIGFLVSRLWKGSGGGEQAGEPGGSCWLACLRSEPPASRRGASLQFTNDGFQKEAEQGRGTSRRWNSARTRRSTFPLPRGRCASCGGYSNHLPKGSPLARRSSGDGDESSAGSSRARQRRREGQKTVWFKESKDSCDIEVEIIPDTVGRVEEETEEELEVEMEEVVRDPAAPRKESAGGPESEDGEEERPEEDEEKAASEKGKESQEEA